MVSTTLKTKQGKEELGWAWLGIRAKYGLSVTLNFIVSQIIVLLFRSIFTKWSENWVEWVMPFSLGKQRPIINVIECFYHTYVVYSTISIPFTAERGRTGKGDGHGLIGQDSVFGYFVYHKELHIFDNFQFYEL